MSDRFHKYLSLSLSLPLSLSLSPSLSPLENKIIYPKQFVFEICHPSNQAIIQLLRSNENQIFDTFEIDFFTQGVFINLSKAFDTIDHKLFLKKLKLYSIRSNNHS